MGCKYSGLLFNFTSIFGLNVKSTFGCYSASIFFVFNLSEIFFIVLIFELKLSQRLYQWLLIFLWLIVFRFFTFTHVHKLSVICILSYSITNRNVFELKFSIVFSWSTEGLLHFHKCMLVLAAQVITRLGCSCCCAL